MNQRWYSVNACHIPSLAHHHLVLYTTSCDVLTPVTDMYPIKGGKNVTITIGEDLSELERRLSAEIGCGPIVPLEVLPADTPCSIHDGVGHHINDTSSSSVLFKTLPSQVHLHRLYMVPPDRNYMLPTVEVGHVLEIPSTVATGPCGQIRFTTLSLSPKAFLLENLFSKEEGYDVIQVYCFLFVLQPNHPRP